VYFFTMAFGAQAVRVYNISLMICRIHFQYFGQS